MCDVMSTYFVTGGCGFIGSNFILAEIAKGHTIVNLDNLGYAANTDNLRNVADSSIYHFVKGDICDPNIIKTIFDTHKPDAVIHFAAESHVDNSISAPEVFIQTNVMGTYHLLEGARNYWNNINRPDHFRFIHISTDEVYGELEFDSTDKFSETTSYAPNSPYSASKAGSDHLARAWFHTYQLPVIITNCSNNYGLHQHPEKLIPNMITHALAGKKLPVYGQGLNIRDWIYVGDHCRGIALTLEKGTIGSSYCFGGNSERRNIDLVTRICEILDELKPRLDGQSYKEQISFVTDRAGHDKRYAIDDTKARNELGYQTNTSFEERLRYTVEWFVDNL